MQYNFESPIGNIVVTINNNYCTSLDLAPMVVDSPPTPESRLILKWLADYFEGIDADPQGLPINLIGTQFQKKMWSALQKIPFGCTTTYGSLASVHCGSRRYARAVGHAVGANPILIIVPCHRVLAESSPGGFRHGLAIKKFLLDLEKNQRWPKNLL